jgi:hypothetical protein
VQRIAGVGGADVHVDEHGLPAAGHGGVSARHVHRDVFVRTDDDLQVGPPLLAPPGQFLHDGDVVRAEVGEEILHAKLDEAFQQIVSADPGCHMRSPSRLIRDAKGLHRRNGLSNRGTASRGQQGRMGRRIGHAESTSGMKPYTQLSR